MWKSLKVAIDLANPTPSVNQVYLGCTQREAPADMEEIQSRAELLYSLSEKITAWSYNMQGHDGKFVEIAKSRTKTRHLERGWRHHALMIILRLQRIANQNENSLMCLRSSCF